MSDHWRAQSREPFGVGGCGCGRAPQGHTSGLTPGSSPKLGPVAHQPVPSSWAWQTQGHRVHCVHEGIDNLGLNSVTQYWRDHRQEGQYIVLHAVGLQAVGDGLTRFLHTWQDMPPSVPEDSVAARASPAFWVPLGLLHTSRVSHFLPGVTLVT